MFMKHLFALLPLLSGVVSVSFEEDEEGNLCLIAYPLHSESGDLENKDPSADCEPKSKMLKWSNKKQSSLLLENDNYSKDRARHSRKEEKIMRWACIFSTFMASQMMRDSLR